MLKIRKQSYDICTIARLSALSYLQVKLLNMIQFFIAHPAVIESYVKRSVKLVLMVDQ